MKAKKTIVITSGYYNPIHHGHIAYLKKAKSLFKNSRHIAIVNNDHQAIMKKGRVIIPLTDRVSVVEELKCVDEVFISIDFYDTSVCCSLMAIYRRHKDKKIYFVKGGDRFKREIPEYEICRKWGIQIIDKIVPQLQQSRNLIQ